MVHIWRELGIALGLKQLTLERIGRYYRNQMDRCFTEVIAAWLSGEDRPHSSADPNWVEVAAALKSPPLVNAGNQSTTGEPSPE